MARKINDKDERALIKECPLHGEFFSDSPESECLSLPRRVGRMKDEKRDYPKIDIYRRFPNGVFLIVATTTQYQTCKEARQNYAKMFGLKLTDVKAFFAE